ncbi:MAG: hypothetical protein V1875_06620 [Candidatus Altiarchaeota archaeon]
MKLSSMNAFLISGIILYACLTPASALSSNSNLGLSNLQLVTTTTTLKSSLASDIARQNIKPLLDCPDVEWKKEDCHVQGMNYTTSTDKDGCPVIYCVYNAATTLRIIKPIPLLVTTTTVPPQCPDADAAIKACAAKGLGYSKYYTGACTMIQCAQTTSTTVSGGNCPDVQSQMEECKAKGGQISRRYDENKCVVIDCTTQTGTDCPAAADIERTISGCKEKGLDYVTYEKGGCRYAECVQPTNCPSEGDLEYAIRKCKAAGKDYQTYADQNGCRQVKCVSQTPCPTDEDNKRRIEECRKEGKGYAMVPTGAASTYAVAYIPCYRVECVDGNPVCPSIKDDIEACRKQGAEFEYYVDENKCERARCLPKPDGCPPNCPTDDELKEMILKCEANGMGYEFYTGTPTTAALLAQTSQSCRRVRCVQKACPSDAELERIAKDCAAKKLQAQTYEGEDGCKYMRCTQARDCPPYEVTDEIVKACREKKLDVESYVDEKGCKNVRCREPDSVPAVECRKTLKGDCVIVSCSDGYTFDSCNPQGVCPQVECKRFKDEKGCMIKRCTDGSGSRECPDQGTPVECEIVKRDDGCLVKKCSDGKEYVSCPTSTDCRDYVDDKGCKVRECADGTKERVCPDGSQELECKVYTDAAGCQIKECTNGYMDSTCDKAPSCKESKEGDCTVKTCDDGSVTKDCPKGEDVECRTYMSDDGCKVTVCTDGKEDKVCSDMGTTTTSLRSGQEPTQAGGWLSGFVRSLGL